MQSTVQANGNAQCSVRKLIRKRKDFPWTLLEIFTLDDL